MLKTCSTQLLYRTFSTYPHPKISLKSELYTPQNLTSLSFSDEHNSCLLHSTVRSLRAALCFLFLRCPRASPGKWLNAYLMLEEQGGEQVVLFEPFLNIVGLVCQQRCNWTWPRKPPCPKYFLNWGPGAPPSLIHVCDLGSFLFL